MDEVEDVVRAVLCFGWKQSSAMLHHGAGVAELLHVYQPWQATQHVLAAKLSQRVEADVAVVGVPTPCFIIMLHGEAERARDAEAPRADFSHSSPSQQVGAANPRCAAHHP